MHVEFEKLEQRPGSHTVPVKMAREELEALAERMADVNSSISAEENALRDHAARIRKRIKTLEEQRASITDTYHFKRAPKPVEGLWGFEFDNSGKVKCRTCLDRTAKMDEEDDEQADMIRMARRAFATSEDLLAEHVEGKWVGEEHPALPVWERPLGTKWFVDPATGEVYGPIAITEKDLQKELVPETKEFEQFKITFDSETAIPILDPSQVSAAEKKLRDTEAVQERERHAIAEDVHEDCGLPDAWHVVPEGENPETFDKCKAAMLRAANEANAEQQARTQEKYGKDIVLDPEATYPCGRCNVETFGRDLQPITIDDKQVFVCFSCESGVGRADQKPPEKKAKKERKKKGKGEANA